MFCIHPCEQRLADEGGVGIIQPGRHKSGPKRTVKREHAQGCIQRPLVRTLRPTAGNICRSHRKAGLGLSSSALFAPEVPEHLHDPNSHQLRCWRCPRNLGTALLRHLYPCPHPNVMIAHPGAWLFHLGPLTFLCCRHRRLASSRNLAAASSHTRARIAGRALKHGLHWWTLEHSTAEKSMSLHAELVTLLDFQAVLGTLRSKEPSKTTRFGKRRSSSGASWPSGSGDASVKGGLHQPHAHLQRLQVLPSGSRGGPLHQVESGK